MPALWNPQANSIFLQALEQPRAEREAFVRQACGTDALLHEQVRSLLLANEQAGCFLESPATAVLSAVDTARAAGTNPPRMHFLSPTERPDGLGRLGHYEILAVVGSGGFGVVLKAHDEKLQRVVAIKSLAESLAASTVARRRFVREAQNAAAVRHDNVVGIFAVEDAGPVPYLVMELVDGISLEDKLQREGPLEIKELLRIGMQIASGLAAAHKQGLVHRDVKPANILLENGIQRVKITDFGLARLVDDASITQTGLIAGTPAYMSPEQARGERVDARSDLFSLGSVLYALCTGQVPFPAGSSLGVAKKVCEETPRPISELNPAIPLWLSEIVERLHAKDPAGRFQSAEEVAELLGKYLAHVQQASMGLPVIVTAQTSQKAQELQRRWQPSPGVRRWLAVVAAAVILMGATLGFTEARGVTQLAATIIRIFTPEGTLVVEVDDPAVKVTVEGDGGLVITGAGLHEVHLKPGKYQLRADKDGQRVPLNQELVTITRGDRKVVTVTREAPADATAGVPRLLTPAADDILPNGARGRALVHLWEFAWSDVAGAGSYELRVSVPNAGTKPVIDEVTSATKKRIEFNENGYRRPGDGWQWSVRAKVTGVWGPWSEERPFRVAEPADWQIAEVQDATIAPPTLLTPAAGAVLPNAAPGGSSKVGWDFTWTEVPGAAKYQFHEILGDNQSTWALDETDSPSIHKSLFGSVQDSKSEWFWKVRAQVGGKWGRWSEPRVFRVAPPQPPAASSAEGQFVVLKSHGTSSILGAYATLAEAVLRSDDGDAIEIRGNGPFLTKPIRLPSRRTIRAGEGFRPVFTFDVESSTSEQPRVLHLLETRAALVLEGLEFRSKPDAFAPSADIYCWDAPLYVANCRFSGCMVALLRHPACQLRNSQFSNTYGYAIRCIEGSAAVLDNNIVATSGPQGVPLALLFPDNVQRIDITRNVITGQSDGIITIFRSTRGGPAAGPAPLHLSHNIVSGPAGILRSSHSIVQGESPPVPLEAAEIELLLRERISWHGAQNLYSTGTPLLSLSRFTPTSQSPLEPTQKVKMLDEWNKFWDQSDTGSIQGVARFQGGDAVHSTPHTLVPDDFRLRTDSAGYRAGPNGKDLGPDLDLVGPGTAYETWKKTPEYQAWLKETGQLRENTPPPQTGAFVVLGGKGVAERKLDTLAEAVLKSGDGDTIEIRGNGPFLTPPASTSRKALTIRAGQGFRPVVKLDLTNVAPDTRAWMLRTTAPLWVEGIEFQIYRPDNPPGTKSSQPAGQCACLHTVGAPLRVANCRFLGVGNTPFVFAEDVPDLEVCNSLLIGQRSTIYAVLRHGSRCRLDNNLLRGSSGFGLYLSAGESAPSSISITGNTVVGDYSAVSWFLHEWESALAAQSKSTQKLIHCDVAGNLFCSLGTHTVWSASFDSALPGKRRQPNQDEFRQAMRKLVDWNERDNGYWFSGHFANTMMNGFGLHPVQTLEDWVAFWELKETGSTTGAVRFQDGDLRQLSQSGAASLSPDSFQLRSDSFGFRADKNERNLGAEVSLVGPGAAYERWKKTPEYDAWKLFIEQARAARPVAAIEPQAFVVLGRDGRAEQKLDTLAEAVQKSSEGDTIEIRGNGPFETPQLSIATALTIRAGAGYRPVIEAVLDVDSARRPHLTVTRGPLILEGLEFQASVSGGSDCTFYVEDAPCYVANCRFSRCRLTVTRAPSYQVRNSHFSTTRGEGLIVSSVLQGATQVVDNNLVTNGLAASGEGARIDIRRNLVLGTRGSIAVAASNPSREQLPVGLHASQNIFVGTPILRFTEPATVPLRTTAPSGAELETVIRSVIHWQEDGNLYSEDVRFFTLSYGTGRTSSGGFGFASVEPTRAYNTLSEWNEFWSQSDTGAIQGRVQFQGGDAVYSTPHTLEADAFRLREGSPGYRAGPDGKDLGPDIDLVGPGEAYERWKKTPEYQKWLKETGQ